MDTIETREGGQVDFDEMVKGAAKMDTEALEEYHHQIGHLLATRKAKTLTKRESELLLKINESLPAALRKRYDSLSQKMKSETLLPQEYEELTHLVDQIELLDAQRLENLIELALLRNVSIEELLKQLGLKKTSYA